MLSGVFVDKGIDKAVTGLPRKQASTNKAVCFSALVDTYAYLQGK